MEEDIYVLPGGENDAGANVSAAEEWIGCLCEGGIRLCERTLEQFAEYLGETREQLPALLELARSKGVLTDPGQEETEETRVRAAGMLLLQEACRCGLRLTDRQEAVLRLRMGLEDGKLHSLEETGRLMGITRQRVRQIECSFVRCIAHRRHRAKGYADFYN